MEFAKLFNCKLCPDVFHEKKLLQIHEINLHGIKYYHCKECNVFFTFRTNQCRHNREFHPKKILQSHNDVPAKKRKLDTAKLEDTVNGRVKRDSKYICSTCNKRFTGSDNLN